MNTIFKVLWCDSTQGINPTSTDSEADAPTTTPSGRCPDSSHSPLRRNCSTKQIENYDVVFVFKEFYSAVVGSLDRLPESRDGEVLERAKPYLKAITTAEFLVSLEDINAKLKLTKTVAKLQGIKKLFGLH